MFYNLLKICIRNVYKVARAITTGGTPWKNMLESHVTHEALS